MKAATAGNGRPPRNSAEARAFWRAAAMILLFNGLLLAWVLLEPGDDRVSAIVVNVAGFVGPLLVLPLCFGGLLALLWRGGVFPKGNQNGGVEGARKTTPIFRNGDPFFAFWGVYFSFLLLGFQQETPFLPLYL